jgi:tetratricopeptide (TPR) repeat protein
VRGVEGRVTRVSIVARAAALLVLIAATAYALQRFVAKPMRCVYAATIGAARLDARGDRRDSATLLLAGRVRTALRDCDCISPPDARVFLTRGGAAEILGDPRAAIADYRRALAIDHRPELYFNLGLAQLDALDREGAIDSLVTACAFDPARLAEIPYDEIRDETRRRIVARYGADWLN